MLNHEGHEEHEVCNNGSIKVFLPFFVLFVFFVVKNFKLWTFNLGEGEFPWK